MTIKRDNMIFRPHDVKKEKTRAAETKYLNAAGLLVDDKADNVAVSNTDEYDNKTFTIKVNQNNKLFDPFQPSSKLLDEKIAKSIRSESTYKFVSCPAETFHYYSKFLTDRNYGFLRMAQRALDENPNVQTSYKVMNEYESMKNDEKIAPSISKIEQKQDAPVKTKKTNKKK